MKSIMANEVNWQRSSLIGDMLHIEFLDGNSYLYSLQEIADMIASQQINQIPTCEGCGAEKIDGGVTTHFHFCPEDKDGR